MEIQKELEVLRAKLSGKVVVAEGVEKAEENADETMEDVKVAEEVEEQGAEVKSKSKSKKKPAAKRKKSGGDEGKKQTAKIPKIPELPIPERIELLEKKLQSHVCLQAILNCLGTLSANEFGADFARKTRIVQVLLFFLTDHISDVFSLQWCNAKSEEDCSIYKIQWEPSDLASRKQCHFILK